MDPREASKELRRIATTLLIDPDREVVTRGLWALLASIEEQDPEYPSLEYFKNKIDQKWHPALEKAWNWEPKVESKSVTTPAKAMKKVKNGKKALAYGWREDYLRQYADKFGLESDGVSAFLPENQDLADLMKSLKGADVEDRDNCFLFGILLGYPLKDVEWFCGRYMENETDA